MKFKEGLTLIFALTVCVAFLYLIIFPPSSSDNQEVSEYYMDKEVEEYRELCNYFETDDTYYYVSNDKSYYLAKTANYIEYLNILSRIESGYDYVLVNIDNTQHNIFYITFKLKGCTE